MTRLAVLTAAATSPGQDDALGCNRDLERLEFWLRSNEGGAWETREIIKLKNVTDAQLLLARKKLDDADYAIATFSGHGFIQEDRFKRRTQKIITANGKEMDFDILRSAAPKQILICDSCRMVSASNRRTVVALATDVERPLATSSRSFTTMYSTTPAPTNGSLLLVDHQLADEDPLCIPRDSDHATETTVRPRRAESS